MPKWAAAHGYGAFANDPSLTPEELAAVAAWADSGHAPRTAATKPPGSPASAFAWQTTTLSIPPSASEARPRQNGVDHEHAVGLLHGASRAKKSSPALTRNRCIGDHRDGSIWRISEGIASRSRSPRSKMRTSAAATAGSKWLPEPRVTSAIASSVDMAPR
jgi:hypothetical protein